MKNVAHSRTYFIYVNIFAVKRKYREHRGTKTSGSNARSERSVFPSKRGVFGTRALLANVVPAVLAIFLAIFLFEELRSVCEVYAYKYARMTQRMHDQQRVRFPFLNFYWTFLPGAVRALVAFSSIESWIDSRV